MKNKILHLLIGTLITGIIVGFVSLLSSFNNYKHTNYFAIDSETAGIGEIISSDDTITNSVTFRNLSGQNNQYLLYIALDSTNTGTIKFSLNEVMDWPNDSTPPTYNYFEWVAGSQLRITVSTNTNLFYKASSTNQKFVVTN